MTFTEGQKLGKEFFAGLGYNNTPAAILGKVFAGRKIIAIIDQVDTQRLCFGNGECAIYHPQQKQLKWSMGKLRFTTNGI